MLNRTTEYGELEHRTIDEKKRNEAQSRRTSWGKNGKKGKKEKMREMGNKKNLRELYQNKSGKG